MVQIDITNFYYETFSKSTIFNPYMISSIEKGYYDDFIISDNFFETFFPLFYNLLGNRVLEKGEINNGLRIVNYLWEKRQCFCETKEETALFRSAINEFIGNCNRYKGPENRAFYLREIMKHFHIYRGTISQEQFERCKRLVKEAYISSFAVLHCSLEITSEEEFQQFVEQFKDGIIYLLCLNAFLIDHSEILDCASFLKRSKIMLAEIKNTQPQNKDSYKFIHKQLKRYQKTIPEE